MSSDKLIHSLQLCLRCLLGYLHWKKRKHPTPGGSAKLIWSTASLQPGRKKKSLGSCLYVHMEDVQDIQVSAKKQSANSSHLCKKGKSYLVKTGFHFLPLEFNICECTPLSKIFSCNCKLTLKKNEREGKHCVGDTECATGPLGMFSQAAGPKGMEDL